MKSIKFAAVSLVATMMAAGCSTVYRVSETVLTDEASQSASRAVATRRPVASVKAKASDACAKSLAAGLKASLENDLMAHGFDVVSKHPADCVVSFSVSCRETAKLNEWRTYEGKLDARVTESATGRLLGSGSFTAAGQRALDGEKALAGVHAGLYKRLSAWLPGVMQAKPIPLPPPPPGASTARIAISPADTTEDPSDVLVVQRRFMDAVTAHRGIFSCRLAQVDQARQKYVFLVQYDAATFPGGLLNTLVLDGDGLGGNVKLEIVR